MFDLPPEQPPSTHPIVGITKRGGPDGSFGIALLRLLGIYCVCREFHFEYVHKPIERIQYHGLVALLAEQKAGAEQKGVAEQKPGAPPASAGAVAAVAECNAWLSALLCKTNGTSGATGGRAKKVHTITAVENVDIPDDQISLVTLRRLEKAATGHIMDTGAGKPPKRPLVRCNVPSAILDAHPEVYRHARGLHARAGLGAQRSAAAAVDVSDGSHADGLPPAQPLIIGMHVRRGE